jgi:hypothetical protein
MLSGAGLSDEFLLAHILGEQSLAKNIIDLVCTAVKQVLPLDMNLKANMFTESLVGRPA